MKDLTGTRLPKEERTLIFGPTKNHSKRAVSLPKFLRDLLDQHLASAALPAKKQGVRFHDLRHTCAAFLIAGGAHGKVIQSQLGRKTITMTFDRYGHLLPGLADAAAEALDATHTAALAPPPEVARLG